MQRNHEDFKATVGAEVVHGAPARFSDPARFSNLWVRAETEASAPLTLGSGAIHA